MIRGWYSYILINESAEFYWSFDQSFQRYFRLIHFYERKSAQKCEKCANGRKSAQKPSLSMFVADFGLLTHLLIQASLWNDEFTRIYDKLTIKKSLPFSMQVSVNGMPRLLHQHLQMVPPSHPVSPIFQLYSGSQLHLSTSSQHHLILGIKLNVRTLLINIIFYVIELRISISLTSRISSF